MQFKFNDAMRYNEVLETFLNAKRIGGEEHDNNAILQNDSVYEISTEDLPTAFLTMAGMFEALAATFGSGLPMGQLKVMLPTVMTSIVRTRVGEEVMQDINDRAEIIKLLRDL